MKNIKRIAAVVLVLVMTLAITACHKKNEIAVTAKDVEFTSAYYMCALLEADSAAKSKVQETLSSEEAAGEIDYYSKKIDDKDYKTWVKDEALATLKEIAAYKLLCAENKVELDSELKASAESMANYYWSYGNSLYYEPNGVSYETYKKFMVDTYYSEAYFNHLYGEGGEKEISADDIKKELYDKYMIVDPIQAAFEEGMTDEEKTALKKQLDGYAEALNKGTKTFEEVYNEYNKVTTEETDKKDDATTSNTSSSDKTSSGSTSDSTSSNNTSSDATSSDATSSDATTSDKKEETEEEEEEEKQPEPKDSYAQVIGAKDTSYEFEYFDQVKEMKIGEAKVIELSDNAGYLLVVKQDIKADEYYLTDMDSVIRHALKDEEFTSIIDDYKKTFELDVSKYAINQFKVDKIKQPDYSNATY